jgi:hypothetical protein
MEMRNNPKQRDGKVLNQWLLLPRMEQGSPYAHDDEITRKLTWNYKLHKANFEAQTNGKDGNLGNFCCIPQEIIWHSSWDQESNMSDFYILWDSCNQNVQRRLWNHPKGDAYDDSNHESNLLHVKDLVAQGVDIYSSIITTALGNSWWSWEITLKQSHWL